MKGKNFFAILAILALFAACKDPAANDSSGEEENTKANGGAVSAPTVSGTPTTNSITVNAVDQPSTGQTVEYAISTSPTTAPSSGWQPGTTFTGLIADTNYYVYARSASNADYNAGTAARSAQIKTAALEVVPPVVVPPVIVDFESDTLGATTKYTFTRGDNDPALQIVADPAASSQKSLRVATNAGSGSAGYNQAAVIPITLPYSVESWGSLTFRFYLSAGTMTNQTISVYVGNNTSQFVKWGFGNPSNDSNQFANLLLGTVQASATSGSWQNLTIPINNPGSPINNYKNTVYLAIGTNQAGAITYMLDDITFTINSGFVPPPLPPSAPTPASVGAIQSGTYRNLFKEWGKTDAQVDAKVQAAWNQLFVNGAADQKIFIEVGNDMAYIPDVNNNDVRSEGMSYGMMMCVQMNDKTRFDKLWKWAHTYMYNDRNVNNTGKNIRGFFKWQVHTNGTEMDNGSAPDGEFYFVTALLFASARWGDGSGINEYGRYARYVLYDMLHREPGVKDNYGAIPMINPTHKLPEFTTVTAQHTDPSYILPAFYDVWAKEIEEGEDYWDIWGGEAAASADAAYWREVATAGREFFPKTVNSTTGLGPDYANYNGAPGSHGDFEYDAWRIAMNIGFDYSWWAKDPWQITQSDRIQSFFHGQGVESYGNRYTLSGTKLGSDHSPGLVACNAVASLAASQALTWDFIENFWNISMTTGQYRYYDGCLYMMGLLHVSGNFKAYFPPNRAKSSNIAPTTATFDKNAAGANYKDIAVTMTLNGNTLSSISGGSPSITTGNYTVSGNTVTIKKEYLAGQSVGATTLTFNFSAGSARSIAIAIGDTTGGGPIGGAGTEIDFTTNPSVTVEYDRASAADLSAEVTNGVLRLTKTTGYSTPKLILDFDLGSTTLGSYSTLRFVIRGVSGDHQSKQFKADVSTDGTAYTAIGSVSTGSGFGTTFANVDVPIGASAVTGSIKIRFYLDNTNPVVYEVQSIKFVQ